MVPERNEDYMTLGSRMSVMERILKALGDANINKIGVSGLAGVGKSTLMEEIHRQAKKERLFNEVALEKVTDNPNISRIQGEIAYMLNLQFNSNETEIRRANRLRTRLQKGNEILIILDDIWKTLDLNAIGIPSKGCKLLLTSRDQRVLASHMGTEKNFELDILGEEEAWNLFEKMAGDSVKDDLDLRNEAIKVAKACAGLPIALVTISRALKD
ncbi:disease resistance protein At4g27190-like [Carya illinoinensis]|uniref:disease resistance protein At4g27190-like n=1 Tax=Carya illinoinensis TaxID=32201 RepID=UPI001C719530|nr:disease resistance protein At4g27190-like [Carya illinoinensis]